MIDLLIDCSKEQLPRTLFSQRSEVPISELFDALKAAPVNIDQHDAEELKWRLLDHGITAVSTDYLRVEQDDFAELRALITADSADAQSVDQYEE